MPELARTRPYRLPAINFNPARVNFRPAPDIVPDTAAASTLTGSTVTMANVADTLAQLPDLISGGIAKGRKQAEQEAVGKIKMGALAGGLTPAQKKAYDGLIFGADNSVAIKAEDPALELAKVQALYGKANPVSEYNKQWGFTGDEPAADPTGGNGGALSGGVPRRRLPGSSANNAVIDGGVTGEVLPPVAPLPAIGGAETPAVPVVVAKPALAPALGQGSVSFGAGVQEPALPAVPQVAPAPPTPGAYPEPTKQGLPAEAPQGAQIIPPSYQGDTGLMALNGKTIAVWPPGAKTWHYLPKETTAPAATGVSAEATELIKRGHTVAQIATMTDAEKQAELARPPIDKPSVTENAIDKAIIQRGGNPQTMSADEKTDYLTKQVPLKPAERISAERNIKGTYHELPSTVMLFGKGQVAGLDTIKGKLDEMLAAAGGDYAKLSPQQQKSFIFQVNKLNDPNSAVLITEYKAAADTLGIIDKFDLMLNKAASGEQATPKQLKDIHDTVNIIHSAAKKAYLEDIPALLEAAKEIGSHPRNIGIPAKAEKWLQTKPSEAAPTTAAPADTDRVATLQQALATGEHEGQKLTPAEIAAIKMQLERLAPKTP